MDLKELLYKKKLKQSELAKLLKMDTGRVSLCVNGVMQFPKKYHKKLSEILEIPLGDFYNPIKKGESK